MKKDATHNVELEAKKTAIRKEFYDKFKKAFDTKTVTAEADSGTWKAEFQYVHIFEKEVKHQLFYYQFTVKTLYFVVNRKIAEKAKNDTFIVKCKDVIKDNAKKTAKIHTCSKLYVDFTDIKEVAKFAKRLTAIAHEVAKEEQEEKTAEETK